MGKNYKTKFVGLDVYKNSITINLSYRVTG